MSVLVECPHCSTRVLPMDKRTCPACRKNVDTKPAPGPTPEQVARASLHQIAAVQLHQGASPAQVQKHLADRGVTPEAAASVVVDVAVRRAEVNRAEGQWKMLSGGMCCLIGLVVTVVSMQLATNMTGGRFLIAWGAVVYGAIRFLSGAAQWMNR